MGFVSVGYHSSVSMMRLHPTSSVGVTLASSSGSLIALEMFQRAIARNGWSSQRRFVIAAAPSSMNPNTAARSIRCSAGKRSNRRWVRSL